MSPAPPSSSREHDIVLFGATGFTGKLVAEYLAKHARQGGKGVRWAIAGRNAKKLEGVKRDLVAIDAALESLPILIADGHDEASLDALVPKTHVICTTVGPFGQHGRKLVAACARHGTHYCDITGEVPFIRTSIDENHAKATETRARIVHCCGFDSIPSDLGVHLVWDEARKHGGSLSWTKGFVGEMSGTASGGTAATMLAIVEEATRDPEVRRLLGNPHALDPEVPRGRTRDPFEADPKGVAFDEDIHGWTAPFVMSTINTRIVRRSNALLHYGSDFRYREAMSLPKGPKGLAAACVVTAGMGAFAIGAALPPTRALLARFVLPKPGEGPSREARERGHFTLRFVGEGKTESGATFRATATVKGTSDPGYGETAKMLGQSALCLAQDGERLEPRFGVLTPASAMGMTLVERLRREGMTFAVERA
ncbi:MAG: hypothetical protein JWP87_4144 [Labilithrix sp.]|nr:hypothetical protein [Labilithrix sp.]